MAGRGSVLRDTFWAATLNILTKFQALSIVVSGFLLGGVVPIGTLAAITSAAAFAAGLADFGFGTDAGRLVAADPRQRTAKAIVVKVPLRACLAAVIAPVVLWTSLHGDHAQAVSVLLLVSMFGMALATSTLLVQVMNGLGQFGGASSTLGALRTVGGVIGAITAYLGSSLTTVAVVFTACECAGALWLLVRVHALIPYLDAGGDRLELGRSYLWLGVGSTMNLLVNRCDVLLVGAVASPITLGVYSIASQLQNAVSSLAQASAFSLPVHIARDATPNNATRLRVVARRHAVWIAVATTISTVAAFLVFANLITGDAQVSSAANQLCVVIAASSSVLIALSAVSLGAATGLRAYRLVGLVRVANAAIAVPALCGLAFFYGPVGAACACLLRDGSLLALSNRAFRRARVAAPFASNDEDPPGHTGTRTMTTIEASLALRAVQSDAV